MRVRVIGSNMSEVETKRGRILISYSTPVSAFIYGEAPGKGCYRTEKFWSKTTSKHINKWLNGSVAEEKPQEFFDNLV